MFLSDLTKADLQNLIVLADAAKPRLDAFNTAGSEKFSLRKDPALLALFAAVRALTSSARAEVRSVVFIGRGDHGPEQFLRLKERTLRHIALGEDEGFNFGCQPDLLPEYLRKGAASLGVDVQ